jgi:hypothetical protein
MAEINTFSKDAAARFPESPKDGEFDFVIDADSFDLNESNRSVIIWKGYIASKADTTLMYLVWDRIDEAMYMRVTKRPADGVKYDIMNEVETLNHRIYPALVDGAPTVASQLTTIKDGFKPRELPEGNSMTVEIISLEEIKLTFTEEVFTNSLESREIQIIALPQGYILDVELYNGEGGNYYTNGEIVSTQAEGGGIDAICQVETDDEGRVTSVTIPEWGGIIKSSGVDQYGYVNETDTSVITNPLAGGQGYTSNVSILNLFGGNGGSGAQAIVTSVVNDPLNPIEPEYLRIENISSETKKGFSINLTGFTLEHDTTYKVLITDVLNLSKQSVSMEAFATTIPEPQPCPLITSILFEAFGSGERTLLPISYVAPPTTHTNTQFLYYGVGGISWAEFITQSEFTGANPEIQVPTSVTAPTTVYAYYRDGAYLLPDSTWIVGIIGDETNYEGNYEYVLYTLDNILNYKQLTPAGSSTDTCGTSGWGGDWGGDIQQFVINRGA